jgi:hypothetical protein
MRLLDVLRWDSMDLLHDVTPDVRRCLGLNRALGVDDQWVSEAVRSLLGYEALEILVKAPNEVSVVGTGGLRE